jgi:deoxyribodipyrimidine photo-lyase
VGTGYTNEDSGIDPRRILLDAGSRVEARSDQSGSNSGYVLYWMQHAQRSQDNYALEFAVQEANRLGVPLFVLFVLTDGYPEANARHYAFMLEGIADVARALAARGIAFTAVHADPPAAVRAAAANARLLVVDAAYQRHLRAWRSEVRSGIACPMIEIESDVVVPVHHASQKREFAARTIRRKIHAAQEEFLVLPEAPELAVPNAGSELPGLGRFSRIDPLSPEQTLAKLDVDRSVPPVPEHFVGGEQEAKRRFGAFLESSLSRYQAHRNQPQTDDTSHMSPYLHFGQVSPVWLALSMRRALGLEDGGPRADKPGSAAAARRTADSGDEDAAPAAEIAQAFEEELIVRRELAFNYVYYEPHYDAYEALPDWALRTLAVHAEDERPERYSLEQLTEAQTADEYWNAAMLEMRHTGYMHNYMRMYWGKKILEWSPSPAEAFRRVLWLNNRFFLDGRDPNSYANVGWIFGLHDRPWQERPIYGKVRTMTAKGLKRKGDPDAYVRKVRDRIGI